MNKYVNIVFSDKIYYNEMINKLIYLNGYYDLFSSVFYFCNLCP